MDNGAERIAEDIKAIAQTRMAMAEKLGAIEQQVHTTLDHAKTTMTQFAVKTTSSVRDTMQRTQEVLDPRVHAARHPWAFVGVALALGFAGGALSRLSTRSTTGAVPYYPPGAGSAEIMPPSGSPSSEREDSGVYSFYPHQAAENGREEPGQSNRLTMWDEVQRALHDELGVVRNGVIRFGRGIFRELVCQAVPALGSIIGGNRRERGPRSEHDPEVDNSRASNRSD